jgi:hypothetical protein
VDAGHISGTGAMTTDGGMTMNQAVPQDSYQTFHRNPLHLQQEILAAGPVVSSSPYLYSFQQHRNIPSDFSTASGLMSGSMDLDSELFASKSFNQILPDLQPPMNNLSPSFNSAFPSVNSHPITSDGSIFNVFIVIPNSRWPVAGNYIITNLSESWVAYDSTSPTAAIDSQL